MSWKFNPPPGWPVPADASWLPPPGWAPDPSWPAAPAGWEFWVPSPAPADLPPEPSAMPAVDPWPTLPPFPLNPSPGPAIPAPAGSPPPAAPGGAPGPGNLPGPGNPPTIQAPAYPYPPQRPPQYPYPYPYQPVPPARPAARSGTGWTWGIVAGVAAVVLVMCTGGAIALAAHWSSRQDREAPPLPGAGPPAAPGGWEDCGVTPNTCNSGPVTAGGELVWAAGSADNWNVNTSLGSTQTMHQIMTGVAPSPGTFLPDGSWQWNLDLLAAEPELTRDDPQTWVYRIRPEATWSDGTPITAGDFAFLWRQGADDPELCGGCAAAFIPGYDRIDRVEGDDDGRTVTVTMKEGDAHPDWWSLFTNLYPAHLAEAAGFDLDTPTGMADASQWFGDTVPDWSGGPWRVSRGDLGWELVLEPNDRWYGEVHPALDRIVFRIDDDAQSRQVLVNSQQADGLGPRPDPDPPVVDLEGLYSHIGPSYVWDHLDFNVERPGLDDVALRRAIFTAIDVDAILTTAYSQSGGTVERKLSHLFRPESPFYTDHISATGQGDGDVTAALTILAEAGYVLEDSTLTLDGEPVGPLVLQHSEGHQRRAAVAELVREHLAQIGIEVEIRPGPLLTLIEERDYDLILFGWSGSPAVSGSGNQFWHSEHDDNFGRYHNDEVDSLVLAANYGTDPADSASLLNEANAIVASEAYVLPLAYTPQQHVVSDRFRNIRPNPAATIFYNSHEWGVAG